jgi:hypothetical protein
MPPGCQGYAIALFTETKFCSKIPPEIAENPQVHEASFVN